MKNIKLLAFDLDGTLLDSGKNPPKDFKEFVLNHSEYKFVLASGRQVYKLIEDFKDLEDNLIFMGDNGSFCVMDNQMIFSHTMPRYEVKKVLDSVSNNPELELCLCGKDAAYILKDVENLSEFQKYYAKYELVDNLYDVLEKDEFAKVACFVKGWNSHEVINTVVGLPESVLAVTSGAEWIDISIKDNDKGRGIRKLMSKLNIDKSECVAFGDQMNDYAMLKSVGYPIAMENGHEKLKEIAYYITDTNDNDGVMKVLKSLNEI